MLVDDRDGANRLDEDKAIYLVAQLRDERESTGGAAGLSGESMLVVERATVADGRK